MDYVVLFVGDHELRACRVCLNIDDTLRPMDELFSIYVQLSGLPVTSYDGLPKLACSVCRTHLHNATALFKRARQSYGVLKNYVGERGMLTNESLQQLSKIYYKPIYTRTRTKSFAVPKTLVPVVVLVKEELHNISSNKEEKPNTSKVKRKPNVTGVRREIQFRSLRNNSSPEVVEEEKIEDMEEDDDNNSTEEVEGTRTEKEYVNNESEEEYLNIESEEEDNNSVEEEGEETKTEEEVNYGLRVDDNNRTEEEDNNAEGEDYRGEDTEEDGDPTYLEEEYLSESNSEEAEPLTKQSSKNKSKSTVKRLKNRYNNIMESKGLKEITEKKSKFLHWEQDLKAYCTAIVRSVKTTGKYKFYEHIIEKYINKVKPIDHDPPVAIDADNKDEIPTIVEEGKKEFYDYIVKKYIKKEIEQKEPLKIHMVTKVKKISCKSFKTVEDQEQFSQDYKCDFEYLSTMAEKIACLKTKKEEKKYKDATFKCELCYEGYMVEAAYKKHMINHDPSLPHECPVCHKRYDSRLLWGRHLLRHNAKMTCRLCGKISFATHIAKHHYLTHAGQEYTCEHCGKFFVRYKSKLEHVRIHHGSECCPLCYELFTPFGLRIHNARAHTKTFPCECGAVFSVSVARDSHRPYCGAGGRPCAVCGAGFPAEDELAWQKHIATHRTKKPRMFIQRSRGSAPITFICEVCAKIFKSEAALRLHQMSHTGEKPLQCAYCDRRFRYKTALEIHIRCHTGERPYKCMLCEKTFKAISALKVHQLVHTQERNFPCDLCPKAFQTKYTLKLHVRSVHQGLRTRIRIRKKQQTE